MGRDREGSESENAIDLVIRFLKTMEARDLQSAEAMMAPEATITFPGGTSFSSQRDMVKFSRGRYKWVKKTFDQVDVHDEDDIQVVYVIGTLYGVNRHDVHFCKSLTEYVIPYDQSTETGCSP